MAYDSEVHKTGISSTDIAAIFGISLYGSPKSVYCSKRGLILPGAGTMSKYAEAGLKLERTIFEWGCEANGIINGVQQFDVVARNPERDWCIGSPDGFIGDDGLIECKNVGVSQARYWGEVGSDQIPEAYQCQVQWLLFVTERKYCLVFALIGGNDLRTYRVERNQALIETIYNRAQSFWFDNVVAGVPPEEVTELDALPLQLLHPRPEDVTVETDDGKILEICAELDALKIAMDGTEERKKLLENKLKERIGDANKLLCGKYRATWSIPKDSTKVDWKGVAMALNPPVDVLRKFTTIETASRRFYFKNTEVE